AKLTVRYPLDEYRRYTYPAMGHSRSTFTSSRGDYSGRHHGRHGEHHNNDWLHDLLDLSHGDRIEVSGRSSGDALELWADVTIRGPASRNIVVQLGCGKADANGVTGDVDLYVKSGEVNATDIKGDLLADTGSGDVDVRGVEGELDVDTGSGSIEAGNVRGAKKV